MNCKTALLLVSLLTIFSFSIPVFAQSQTVTGKVTNKSDGGALQGATITVKGSTNGTKTDANGNFSITASSGSVLKISYIGMTEREISLTSSSLNGINVELDPLPNSVNEVVVVGYGTQKRSVVTAAISSVKATDLENVPSHRLEQSLQGRVSGVT